MDDNDEEGNAGGSDSDNDDEGLGIVAVDADDVGLVGMVCCVFEVDGVFVTVPIFSCFLNRFTYLKIHYTRYSCSLLISQMIKPL